ncbi:MAG: hypothetical protein AB7J13_05395 [Pyrinomonadaceae bacterium]
MSTALIARCSGSIILEAESVGVEKAPMSIDDDTHTGVREIQVKIT